MTLGTLKQYNENEINNHITLVSYRIYLPLWGVIIMGTPAPGNSLLKTLDCICRFMCICVFCIYVDIPGGFLPCSLLLGLPDCCESENTNEVGGLKHKTQKEQ